MEGQEIVGASCIQEFVDTVGKMFEMAFTNSTYIRPLFLWI